MADATNLIALHISDQLKSGKLENKEDYLRFCTTHRHVRAQSFKNAPGSLPHFHLLCLVTSGKDKGSYSFEKASFLEHISVYKDVFKSLFQSEIEVDLSVRKSGYSDSEGLVQRVLQIAQENSIDVSIVTNSAKADNHYYEGLQFTIRTTINGRVHIIGDGGFVDWSQQLVGNQKERMLISAIGLDRLLLK